MAGMKRGAALSILIVMVSACAHHTSAPRFRHEIAGRWALNAEESSAMRPDSGESNPGERAGRGGGPGRIGIGGRGRGGIGNGPGMQGIRADAAEARYVLLELMEASKRLVIADNDSTISVGYADSSTLLLHVDGKKRKYTMGRAGEVETKASWQEGGLEVERKFKSGITLKEEYSHAPGSPRLIVTTTIKGGIMNSRTTRRVYDAES
jgi:hypothetical protein